MIMEVFSEPPAILLLCDRLKQQQQLINKMKKHVSGQMLEADDRHNIVMETCMYMCPMILAQTVSILIEPRREKTGFLQMRKQRRRSASR